MQNKFSWFLSISVVFSGFFTIFRVCTDFIMIFYNCARSVSWLFHGCSMAVPWLIYIFSMFFPCMGTCSPLTLQWYSHKYPVTWTNILNRGKSLITSFESNVHELEKKGFKFVHFIWHMHLINEITKREVNRAATQSLHRNFVLQFEMIYNKRKWGSSPIARIYSHFSLFQSLGLRDCLCHQMQLPSVPYNLSS